LHRQHNASCYRIDVCQIASLSDLRGFLFSLRKIIYDFGHELLHRWGRVIQDTSKEQNVMNKGSGANFLGAKWVYGTVEFPLHTLSGIKFFRLMAKPL
jgi:hypothetical protein